MITNGSLTSGSFGGLGQYLPGFLRGGSFVAGVEVGVLTSENHTFSSTPTDTAIESGATVSDHAILKPDEVTIAFGMSNTGLGPEGARATFDQFEKMLKERVLLELTTEHKVYENMLVVGFTPSHSAPYKGALQCGITLRKINLVELESRGRQNAASGKSKGHADKTATPEVNAGKQDGKPSDDTALYKFKKGAGS